jgi:ABC-type sugar transport system substrate-binding protein
MKIADLLVSLLPAKLRPYGKAVAALVLSGLALAATAAGAPAYVGIILMVLNAPVVYGMPNETEAEAAPDEDGYTEVELEVDEDYAPAHAAS